MKTIGILGSARKGGNTRILLDEAPDEAREKMRAHFKAIPMYRKEFDMLLHRLVHERYGL